MCAQAAAPSLVARKAELGELRSALEQAAAGRSTTVLVAGDPPEQPTPRDTQANRGW